MNSVVFLIVQKLRRGLGRDGEAVGCDEGGASADAGEAF